LDKPWAQPDGVRQGWIKNLHANRAKSGKTVFHQNMHKYRGKSTAKMTARAASTMN